MKAALIANPSGTAQAEKVNRMIAAENFDAAFFFFSGAADIACTAGCRLPNLVIADNMKTPDFLDAAGIRFLPFSDTVSASGKLYRLQTDLGRLRRLGSSSPFPTVVLQNFELGEYADHAHLLPAMSGYNCLLALAGTGRPGISTFGSVQCVTAASLTDDHAFTSVLIHSDGSLEHAENIKLN